MPDPATSRQRLTKVCGNKIGHIGGTLRSLAVICFAHRMEAIPPTLSQTTTMRLSPFPILLAALAIGTVWAGQDASARFNRCTESQSLAHCQLIFYGR